MKILKKNQIIISVLALMLITVGYMNYTSNITKTIETGNFENGVVTNANNETENLETGALLDGETMAGIGDAKLVNSNNVDETNEANEANTQTPIQSQTILSHNDGNIEYFASSRLERDKMYSQMLETYQKLLESQTVSAEQKTVSTQEIANINNTKNAIMITENLIKNLGFENTLIFVNDNSVSIIIKAEKLEEADIAKIQNIVCREIGVETEKIHISLK